VPLDADGHAEGGGVPAGTSLAAGALSA